MRTASNANNEKKYEFYLGCKNHILIDAISYLPISEVTTTANVADREMAIHLLEGTHSRLSLDETFFIADKGYDIKDIYNYVYSLRTESIRYNSRWKNLNTDKA
ncbi:MAG TPA: transposase [Pseudobacteroides sp.]|uniref:transposase n=1 Tax=Pseudobacteroides sp. TaxID=1968840 RepID=UPI002F9424F6